MLLRILGNLLSSIRNHKNVIAHGIITLYIVYNINMLLKSILIYTGLLTSEVLEYSGHIKY